MNNYTGRDVLENLQEAVNYNSAIANIIKNHAKEGEVLDFGAGVGTFADLVDLSPDCLEIDQKQAAVLRKKGYNVVQEIKKNHFDFIYSLNVLEHIEDDKLAVKSLIEGLKKDGILLIFVPAFKFLFSKFDERLEHFRRYDKKTLSGLFDDLDVEVLRANYFDIMGFFFALFFKVLRFEGRFVNKRNIVFFDRLFFPFNKLFGPFFSRFFGKNLLIVVKKR